MTTQSLAQQFAAEYAKDAVPSMLKTVKGSKWKARAIMSGVFAVTYQHQAEFLSADPSIGRLGWIIPGINDLAMLTMVGFLQTTAMDRGAKKGAGWMLGLCGGLSATINVAAPGSLLARVIFGVLVALVVGLKLVTARIKPDFAALEQAETGVAAPVAVLDEAKQTARSEAAKRGAATRAAKRKAQDDERTAAAERRRIARMERQMRTAFDETVAPVSPAGEQAAYL